MSDFLRSYFHTHLKYTWFVNTYESIPYLVEEKSGSLITIYNYMEIYNANTSHILLYMIMIV